MFSTQAATILLNNINGRRFVMEMRCDFWKQNGQRFKHFCWKAPRHAKNNLSYVDHDVGWR